jgi:Fe-S-cluster containining protein
MRRRPWFADGLRFGCTISGRCCRSHGDYTHVYFTQREERRLARHLDLSIPELRRRYIKIEGGYRVARSRDSACVFLDDCSCIIYPVRPVPCRTWPFWPELRSSKWWKSHVLPVCQGAGSGRMHSLREIESAMRQKVAHDAELENDD